MIDAPSHQNLVQYYFFVKMCSMHRHDQYKYDHENDCENYYYRNCRYARFNCIKRSLYVYQLIIRHLLLIDRIALPIYCTYYNYTWLVLWFSFWFFKCIKIILEVGFRGFFWTHLTYVSPQFSFFFFFLIWLNT